MDFIGPDVVKELVSMSGAINLMEQAFRSLSEGKSVVPVRSVVESPDKNTFLFFKPVFDHTLGRMAVKVLSQNEGNRDRGIPTISGIVMLFDGASGHLLSVMDGAYLTALRTGAVGGLATKLLSRDESDCFALFGCGVQGMTQLEAVLSVRRIKRVYLFDTDKSAALDLISKMQSSTDAKLSFTTDLNKLKEADIITTATGSRVPLFERTHIKPGVHINAVGGYKPHMQELPVEIIRDARVVVDQKEACLKEAGDLVIPFKNGIVNPDHILGEIGELITGRITGRVSDNDITVFKSVGIAVQDLYIANAVYEHLNKKD